MFINVTQVLKMQTKPSQHTQKLLLKISIGELQREVDATRIKN